MPKKRVRPNRRTVEAIVRHAVGQRRAQRLSKPEIDRLVRDFVSAGRDAVWLRFAAPRRAADLAAKARYTLGRARDRLAETTRPGDEFFVERAWRGLMGALERNRNRLLSHPGAVGLMVSHRRRGGTEVTEPCVVVLVDRKRRLDELATMGVKPLPSSVRGPEGARFPVDVIQVGKLEQQARAGEPIAPDLPDASTGTLGAFGRDQATDQIVAITAMHVAGGSLMSYPSPSAPEIREHLVDSRRPFGRLLRGSRIGTDAAAVLLNADEATQSWPLGPVRGWRSLLVPGDRGTRVRMYGAASRFLICRRRPQEGQEPPATSSVGAPTSDAHPGANAAWLAGFVPPYTQLSLARHLHLANARRARCPGWRAARPTAAV